MNAENLQVASIVAPASLAVRQATVVSVAGAAIVIDDGAGPRPARLAFSCLVRPREEDIVIFSQQASGNCHVLGIVERPGDQEMNIEFAGDATLASGSGRLSLVTGGSISLVAGESLDCLSERVIHRSREAVVDYRELSARGQNLQASFANIRVFSELMCSVAKQVIDRFKSYIRHSADFDQVRAGQMTREVSGLYSVNSRSTVMVSRKDTKIDGERIHMG